MLLNSYSKSSTCFPLSCLTMAIPLKVLAAISFNEETKIFLVVFFNLKHQVYLNTQWRNWALHTLAKKVKTVSTNSSIQLTFSLLPNLNKTTLQHFKNYSISGLRWNDKWLPANRVSLWKKRLLRKMQAKVIKKTRQKSVWSNTRDMPVSSVTLGVWVSSGSAQSMR